MYHCCTIAYVYNTGNPSAVLAKRIIRCIYAVLATKIMRCILPVFLCLYQSFWKGFESDQRQLTLLVSNGCLSGSW